MEWIEQKENAQWISDPQRVQDVGTWFHGSLPIANQKPLEMVLMRGPPGCGKTRFARKYLESQGYEWLNQDVLKTKAKMKKAITTALKGKKSVIVDKTHPDRASRREWMDIGKSMNAHIRLFNMTTPREIAEHNNMVRVRVSRNQRTKVSSVVYHTFYKKAREDEELSLKEGFDEIVHIDFVPEWKDENERKMWMQFTSFGRFG